MTQKYRVKLSTKGQLVIPAAVREGLGLTADTELELSVKNGVIEIESKQSLRSKRRAVAFKSLAALADRVSEEWNEEQDASQMVRNQRR
jgi:AbrB family looped-hinge helix DNA binding protein